MTYIFVQILKPCSFQITGKYIQPLGINVGVGLFVQGKINIFGMEVWGKIILQPDKNVYEIDIQMTPLDLVNGLIAVRRNEQDKKNGPKCWIRIRPDFLRVDIEGYAEVLGINNYVMIQVSDTGFKFNTSGTMMPGIFDAGLYLSATYGNLKTISFEVRHYCYFFTLLS